MRRCYAGFKSLTLALRGKEVLDRNAIESEVVKKDPRTSKKGCSYALTIPCAQRRNCENLFALSAVPYLGITEE